MAVLLGTWSLLKKFTTFIIARWRVFLPLAIVVAVFLCIHTLRVQRDDARQELAEYQVAIDAALQEFAQESRRKETEAAAARDQVQAQHQSEIELLRSSTDELLLEQKETADRTVAGWRERVRLELDRSAAYGLPGLPESAGGSAEGGGECHSADPGEAPERYIEALELGAAITTADYNACISGWTKACQIYGCK
jgi:hypothetical protein